MRYSRGYSWDITDVVCSGGSLPPMLHSFLLLIFRVVMSFRFYLFLPLYSSISLIFQRDSLKWLQKWLRFAISRDETQWREIFYLQQEEREETDQGIGEERISGFSGSGALEESSSKLGSYEHFHPAIPDGEYFTEATIYSLIFNHQETR